MKKSTLPLPIAQRFDFYLQLLGLLCTLASLVVCAPSASAQKPSASAPASPTVAAEAEANSAAAAPAGSAVAPVLIPLIVMDEVPLTDAVRNLARQASLNYMLDPKVAFGQPGADGKPQPQPLVSIRWENITAEQALNALLNNYGLQLVQDEKTHIARVTIRDPLAADPLQTKVIQLQYATISNIITSVQTTLTDKRSKVVADPRTRQLVVVATEKEISDVELLLKRLDTATRQVLIEARLLETSVNPSTAKGVDWSGTLAAQNVSFGNGTISGTSTQTTPGTGSSSVYNNRSTTASSSVSTVIESVMGSSGLAMSTANGMSPNVAFLSADGLKAVLSFLNNYSETKLISSPRMVTLDNEPAHIEVGQQYPIINVSAGTQNTAGGSQVSYSNLTVRLDVTPSISASDFINLRVLPTVMRLADMATLTVGGEKYQAYVFDTRNIETRVMIPSGNTLVMGGLIQDETHESDIKVPLLGDIPGLGYLFRSQSKSRSKSNLTVFITPTIIQNEDFQPTKTDFFKNTFPKNDNLEGDWSAWDSGKPKDWSKKKKDDASAAAAGKFDDGALRSSPAAITNAPTVH